MSSVEDWPLAFLVVDPGTQDEKPIPIRDRLFLGRECAGVDARHRLILDDDTVSRQHLEIRIDTEKDCAFAVDTSTNGTRVNGIRIDRAVPVPLKSGDRILVGLKEFEFRSDELGGSGLDMHKTVRRMVLAPMAMVVGDIISFSTISQYTEEGLLMQNLERLYGELHTLLTTHKGTLNNYVGDAFFAIWEVEQIPNAAEHAVRFALDAAERVHELAPSLDLRDPEGMPIRMGWGVSLGAAAVSAMTGMLVTVIGDTTNVAFRLSGLAGRGGHAEVIVTKSVRDATLELFSFDEPEDVTVKGRKGTETVFGVSRQPAVREPR